MLEKVISGGQTGVDRIGLEVAKELGIKTGGTAPKGWRTERGPDPTLGEEYGLVEHGEANYSLRTWDNVNGSDGTVLFGDMSSSGSKQTIRFCIMAEKPYLVNPTHGILEHWIINNRIKVLNVAGNRGSKLSEHEAELFRKVLEMALIHFI